MSETVLDFTHVGKVAIIGAGVAGLQAASRLKIRGFDITIFEKSDDVGGVWRSNYADFGLQVPKDLYEFIDFPYPKSGDRAGRKYELFPSGPQVADYIRQYCDHKGLREHVRFNTCVLQLKPKEAQARGWRVEYSATQDDKNKSQHEEFDYVIIATGLYSWPPRLPQISGQEAFKGQILHSLDFTDQKLRISRKLGTHFTASWAAISRSWAGWSTRFIESCLSVEVKRFCSAHFPSHAFSGEAEAMGVVDKTVEYSIC